MCDQSPSVLCLGDPVACCHWLNTGMVDGRALSNHVSAPSVISMWHVLYLYHLARACSKQSRSTSILPIKHAIQMPQCLSGFVNHDYWVTYLSLKFNRDLWENRYIQQSTHDTIMSYINTCMVVIYMFYIGMTDVLVDGIHYLEPQKTSFVSP